jgi:hypothetical protein
MYDYSHFINKKKCGNISIRPRLESQKMKKAGPSLNVSCSEAHAYLLLLVIIPARFYFNR